MMSPELLAAAAKLIGVLILIVGGLVAFNLYSRKLLGAGQRTGAKTIAVLESTPLGLKKAVSLVKVPGAVLVVGITNDRISLLERIDEADFKALREIEPSRPLSTFQDHLRRFTTLNRMKPMKMDRSAASDRTPC